MLRRLINPSRPRACRQGELSFLHRSRRLDRAFKVAITGVTLLALGAMLFGTQAGRRLAGKTRLVALESAGSLLGLVVDRAEYERVRDLDRLHGIQATRKALGRVGDDNGPTMREFLRVARLDRDSAVIRWGNFDRSLALSSAVFEPDDAGRSYRLKPSTRSIWLIGLTINDVLAMFEIPDTPEARQLGQAVGGRVVPESVQTTNSWGCRGPEPDPSASVRGIVLGDSNMQGLLVGDAETPPSRLESRLLGELGGTVSILNTGHLGYSPEQYYHSLVAYYDRFHPQFVIISLCANDFGDMNVAKNWVESEYWLDAITQFCRTRNLDYLALPLPLEMSMLGRRNDSIYPAKITAIFDGSGQNYLDPIEEFTTVHMGLRAATFREGKPFLYSPLFNRRYDDHHLSPLGCDLWAEIVTRRLRLIWAQKETEHPGTPTTPDRTPNSPHPGPSSGS